MWNENLVLDDELDSVQVDLSEFIGKESEELVSFFVCVFFASLLLFPALDLCLLVNHSK